MIYEHLEIKAGKIVYKLDFENRITLVSGCSATGKSFLFKFLEDYKKLQGFEKIVTFNYASDDFHKRLSECRERFIVIDNADVILDESDFRFINSERSNQYLLFKREFEGLWINENSLKEFVREGNVIRLKKEEPLQYDSCVDGR